MKSIVVYKITIVIGVLILATGLAAQKPAIDLISSNQQYKHPEAIIDTGYAMNPTAGAPVLIQVPPAQNQKQIEESEKKKRRQIGPSLDSLFQKEDSGSTQQEETPVKISLFDKNFKLLRIFIYITALK
jgi:hypothetical protein